MMSTNLYNDILKTIRSNPRLRETQNALEEKYPTVSTLTLGSILNSFVQRKMKQSYGRHHTPDKTEYYYRKYLQAVQAKEPPGILLRLSDEIEICPVLVARIILTAYLQKEQEEILKGFRSPTQPQAQEPTIQFLDSNTMRTQVNVYLRDTTQIQDRDLAYEVYLCTVQDDFYGPMPDSIKESIGAEYELILKDKLDELGISYVNEDSLRSAGFDKTPDFKLEVPIGVEGRIVNWIESKALFGDEVTHAGYLDTQLNSYLNRFGPGLVIYFLGFVDTLESSTPPGIFIRDHFPRNIVFLKPHESESELARKIQSLDLGM